MIEFIDNNLLLVSTYTFLIGFCGGAGVSRLNFNRKQKKLDAELKVATDQHIALLCQIWKDETQYTPKAKKCEVEPLTPPRVAFVDYEDGNLCHEFIIDGDLND